MEGKKTWLSFRMLEKDWNLVAKKNEEMAKILEFLRYPEWGWEAKRKRGKAAGVRNHWCRSSTSSSFKPISSIWGPRFSFHEAKCHFSNFENSWENSFLLGPRAAWGWHAAVEIYDSDSINALQREFCVLHDLKQLRKLYEKNLKLTWTNPAARTNLRFTDPMRVEQWPSTGKFTSFSKWNEIHKVRKNSRYWAPEPIEILHRLKLTSKYLQIAIDKRDKYTTDLILESLTSEIDKMMMRNKLKFINKWFLSWTSHSQRNHDQCLMNLCW